MQLLSITSNLLTLRNKKIYYLLRILETSYIFATMKHVGDMKLYSFEELLDEDYGKVGTPERDKFERSVDEAVHAYRVGEAIKQAREAQQLTQAELGEKMGVQRSQVCRLESGKSITLSSMMRAFRALGVQVALEMKGIGKVAL